jgi:hypothetical protein
MFGFAIELVLFDFIRFPRQCFEKGKKMVDLFASFKLKLQHLLNFYLISKEVLVIGYKVFKKFYPLLLKIYSYFITL